MHKKAVRLGVLSPCPGFGELVREVCREWIMAWARSLGVDPAVFLVLLIIVAALIYISENIPKIINASIRFISFSANYGALPGLLGPQAHPMEMFRAWLVGGASMSLAVIYGLWVLTKIKLMSAPNSPGADSVAG